MVATASTYAWSQALLERQGLKRFGIAEADWHHLARDRNMWRDVFQEGPKKVQNTALAAQFICETCYHEFRRKPTISRHKRQTTHPRGRKR